MDALELTYPVDVAPPLPLPVPVKLMGSEGFGRARVTVKDVDSCVNPSIERCSTFLRHKDTSSVVTASESVSWDKFPEAEICRHSFRSDDVSEQQQQQQQHHSRGTTDCNLSTTSRPEVVQVQRKAGKVSRSSSSSSGCSKRPRIAAHLDDNMTSARVDDVKDISDKLGSCPTKCNSPEKTQLAKQKNSFSGKRGDKRNLKVPLKNNSFCMKGSLASFGLAAGGNNFFGVHGLKSDIHDVTKLIDDLSLNELLDGTFECPRLGKDKGKKAANMNENILDSIRKACSILPRPRPVQSQNIAETDSCFNKKMLTYPPSSVSFVASGVNGDKEDPCTTDPSSCNKDSCSNPETPVNPLEFPLDKPKDILERLALPPPKDLESLLLDAGKSTVFSRNSSDLRSGKQISRRASLPPFSWSHTSSGHCRTNSDAVKFLASRSTCQGRWVRVGSTASSLGTATDCFTNLESLTYDHSLVPSGGSKLGILENKVGTSMSVSLSSCEWGSLSPATCSKASHVPLGCRGEVKHEVNVDHCPKLLAAAKILYDIATHSPRQNPDGMMKWPKKASQKVMKARKLKSIQKPEEVYAEMTSVLGSDNRVRSVDQIMPSKRPKLSMMENKKEIIHTNCVRKGPVNSSAPRSSRQSPNKSVRESIAETRHLTTNIVKQSYMLPPPARVLDRACNSQQKLRKLMPLDWNRGRDSLN